MRLTKFMIIGMIKKIILLQLNLNFQLVHLNQVLLQQPYHKKTLLRMLVQT